MYNRAARSLVLTYGIILVLHYLVCFVLLCIIYYKLLKYIRGMRREFGEFSSGCVSYVWLEGFILFGCGQ